MEKIPTFNGILKRYNNYFRMKSNGDEDLYQELLAKIAGIDWTKYTPSKKFIDKLIRQTVYKFNRGPFNEDFEIVDASDIIDNDKPEPESPFINESTTEEILIKLIPYVTDRQYKILKYRMEGFSIVDIANLLDLNERTIRRDIKDLEKINIADIINNHL